MAPEMGRGVGRESGEATMVGGRSPLPPIDGCLATGFPGMSPAGAGEVDILMKEGTSGQR